MSATSIRMEGNTLTGRNSSGTVATTRLTFGEAGLNLAGAFSAASLSAAVLNVNDINEFTGNAIVLSKEGGQKSYYGTSTDSCEIATIYDVQLASGGNMTVLAASIAGEVTRATGAENVLSASIAGEVSRATGAENVLSASIAGEVTRALAAEGVLSASIAGETTRALAAEGVLSASIASEVTRATNAESSITTRINNIVNGTETCVSLKVSGDIQAGSVTSYSDARLKTDIEEVANGMDKVKALHPVFYNWISGAPGVNPGHKELGFLAQEVEAVLPGVVRTDSSDAFGKKSVAYDRVVSVLVAAVKELDARLAALEPKA